MNLTHLRGVVFAVIASTPLLSSRATAQTPLEPAQMPSRTSFYLIWRGTPAPEARKTNSLLALWDDPDFAPVRSAMFENMMNSTERDTSKQKLTREEVEKYSALLDNALVLGYIGKPEAKMTERISARMLYQNARLYDEWKGEDYEGSSCRGAMKGFHKHGVCTEKFWPNFEKEKNPESPATGGARMRPRRRLAHIIASTANPSSTCNRQSTRRTRSTYPRMCMMAGIASGKIANRSRTP